MRSKVLDADGLTEWSRTAMAEIAERLQDPAFPCVFARRAWQGGTLRFAFCDDDPFSSAYAALTAYTAFVQSTPVMARLLHPLCIIFRNRQGWSGQDQHAQAWRLLDQLHRRDPAPWPDDVPADPEHPAWSFCFNGVQLFVNMSSQAHLQLRSRNLGHCLVLVINPRENFDVIAGANTPNGRAVRDRIRRRVVAYNGVELPASLGFHGDVHNREWKQYQLDEPGHHAPPACPFFHRHGPRS